MSNCCSDWIHPSRAISTAATPGRMLCYLLCQMCNHMVARAGADCGNLVTYVCTAYQGKKPKVCDEAHSFHSCPGAPSEDTARLRLDVSASQ